MSYLFWLGLGMGGKGIINTDLTDCKDGGEELTRGLTRIFLEEGGEQGNFSHGFQGWV